MARPLRIQFPGAVYHVMARGNARQKIFRDEHDYRRFLKGLEMTVDKFGFEIFAFVCMPNHIHLFLRTPQPNLSQGMQYLLSGYANWFNTRHQRPGHLFQGRFKGELIEDEQYFWTVSRYVHLNPRRGKRPLVERLEEWIWSSYPGYHRKYQRLEWIAYDTLLGAWQGEAGGKDPAAAYRRFVEGGIEVPPENPMATAVDGWLLGSARFVERIKRKVKAPKYQDEIPAARRMAGPSLQEVLEQTAAHYGVSPSSFASKHSGQLSRDVAAWLARRLTVATQRDLVEPFGLGHPDSVRSLVNRADAAMQSSPAIRKDVEQLQRKLQGNR